MTNFKFNITTKKNIVVIISILLIIIIFYYFYNLYFKYEMVEIKTTINELHIVNELLEVKEGNYSNLEQNIIQINNIKVNNKNKVLSYTEMPLQLMHLEHILDDSMLDKYELILGSQQRSTILNSQTIINVNADILAEGSYYNIINFIKRLNDELYTYNLKRIFMNSQSGVVVNAEIEVSMYYFDTVYSNTLNTVQEQVINSYKNPFLNILDDESSDFIE